MKERPILFSGQMVRAILSGQKTQTRRVVKMQPTSRADIGSYGSGMPFIRNQNLAAKNLDCPYGQPGDRLWVRETWQGPIMDGDEFENEYRDNPDKFQRPEYCFYAADDGSPPEFVDADDNLRCCWRPSIHMPRWACRLVLEIVSVRVERLHDISEADAMAEGARRFDDIPVKTPSFRPNRWSMESPENTDQCLSTARWAFANYFCKVNSKSLYDHGPWDANPWVWVIEFRRVQT